MFTSTTHTSDQPDRLQSRFVRDLRRFFLRKLWLPRIVYELLPYLYIAVGLLAVYTATWMPGWAWILPYAALAGLICVHAGLGIAMLRYRARRGRGPRQRR